MAEALRKRGLADEALRVVTQGLAEEPDHLPGRLVLSRIRMDQQDWAGAEAALREAMALDPTNPAVLEGMAEVAEADGRRGEASVWREALLAALPGTGGDTMERETTPSAAGTMDDAETGDPGEAILTESLAVLFRRQGHFERALEVYDALLLRSPMDDKLRARAELLRREFLATRPRPYDAAISGGKSVRTWLAEIAAARPAVPRETGYDAFFESRTPGTSDTADFEAFQSWLKGLGK